MVGFHLICVCPLIASSCGDEQLANSRVGEGQGAGAGNGGSAPAAGGATAAAGGPTTTAGDPTTASGATTTAAGASMGGPSGQGGVGGAGGVAGTGGASNGGSSNGGSSGGRADAGTRGDADAGTQGDGATSHVDGPFAYGITIAPDGSWMGIEDPAAEVAALVASGTKYVRFSRAGTSLTAVGIPDSTNAPYARQMIRAGLSLGAVLIAQNGLPVSDLVDQGNTLKNSGFYDWIFVDGALTRTDIQQVIDGLAGVGWKKIMVNDTLFGTPSAVTDPPKGVWAHSKLFSAVNDPSGPAINPRDVDFIQYIHQHFPDSVALLKLEIDSGVEKFAQLPAATQNLLLTEWSQGQSVYGYTMIYPLFTTTYDSKTAGTYDTQVMLMK
jgi:hypothetical protein